MRKIWKAFGHGCCAAVPTGFFVIAAGGLLGGIYGALYAACLCPMLTLPVGLLGFVVSLTSDHGNA